MRSLWRAAAAALIAIAIEQDAAAAEIRMLAVPGMKAAFGELVPSFERSAGHKVVIRYEIFAKQKAEVEKGEFDVAVFARSVIDELGKQGKITPASTSDLVRTSIGVAVRKGAPKPDISSEDAFKRKRCLLQNRLLIRRKARQACTLRDSSRETRSHRGYQRKAEASAGGWNDHTLLGVLRTWMGERPSLRPTRMTRCGLRMCSAIVYPVVERL